MSLSPEKQAPTLSCVGWHPKPVWLMFRTSANTFSMLAADSQIRRPSVGALTDPSQAVVVLVYGEQGRKIQNR